MLGLGSWERGKRGGEGRGFAIGICCDSRFWVYIRRESRVAVMGCAGAGHVFGGL